MDSFLRDLDREQSKMTADIENLNRHYEKLRDYVRQYVVQTTIEWARLVLNHPQSLLLIVETTRILDKNGLSSSGGENEPIRFTALSLASGIGVYDQLLHPTLSEEVSGTEYHGLTMADLENMPRLVDVWPDIATVLEDRHIVLFGAEHARQALRSVYQMHVLDKAFCLHNKAKEYYGQFYDLSLETVLSYQAINKKRDDLRDSRERLLCLADVLRNLAVGMPKQIQKSESTAGDDGWSDLDEHPF